MSRARVGDSYRTGEHVVYWLVTIPLLLLAPLVWLLGLLERLALMLKKREIDD